MDMSTETINRILSLAPAQPVELEGRPYTTAKVFPVNTPQPLTVSVHTLTAIVDYLNENPDGLELDHLVVHVVSPKEVRVISRLTGPFEDRAVYLASIHTLPEFEFGRYYDIESFVIALQSLFVQSELVASILQLAGTIRDDLIIKVYADDGITQEVTAKSGIGRVENRAVPNPVQLRPFRTFAEIEQPEGRFVLRMKSGSGTNNGRPAIALFEADGGVWELNAIHCIRDWLRDKVPTEVAILA